MDTQDQEKIESPVATTTHLNQRELARRFGISVATIERWRSEQIGPRYLKLCGQIRYRIEDILAYERECLRQGTAKRA